MGQLGFLVDYHMYSGGLEWYSGCHDGSQASCGALIGIKRVLSGPQEFLVGLMDSQRALWVLMWPQE